MREQDDRPIGRTNVVAAGKRRVIPWIWEGVVAEGAVTLLSAPGTPGQHQRPVQPHQPVPGGRVVAAHALQQAQGRNLAGGQAGLACLIRVEVRLGHCARPSAGVGCGDRVAPDAFLI
jgi:hypothetical protein